jgi:hypothetical protein
MKITPTRLFAFIALFVTAFFGSSIAPAEAALSDVGTCDDSLFDGGTGSTETPWLITTPQQLANITFCTGSDHSDKHFKLTGNINLAGFESQFDGFGWMPIGQYVFESSYYYEPFYGNFNGNYKKIQNLTIDREYDFQGLFYETASGSIIENVGLQDVNIAANTAGGIVGYAYGVIRTSYVVGGSITNSSSNVTGGIVAVLMDGASIEDSYTYDVTITGLSEAGIGGIAGYINNNSSITRVYSNATVSTNESDFLGSVGGITGNGEGTIDDSFSLANVSTVGDALYEGNISGKWGDFTGTNNYWLIQDGNPTGCIGNQLINEEVCSGVAEADYFKNITNEPLATWSIATTNDAEYVDYRDGYPFLAWEKDGGSAESTWLISAEDPGEAPETLITSSTAGSIDSGSATFTFVSNDETATFECSIDLDSFAPCTSPFTTVGLVVGAHLFEVRAISASETVDATPAAVEWVVYATSPEVISTEPADGDIDVPTDTTIVFSFAEPVPEGIRDNLAVGSGPCDETCPTLEGAWSNDYQTLTYTNPDPFTENTEYTVTISVNNTLVETLYEISFTTQESTSRRRSVSSAIRAQFYATTPAAGTDSNNGQCSADQILTQNLRSGARDGRYHAYTKAIVKEVKILQAHMNRLGFNSGPVDGILGPITDGAIKRMQVYLGTFADGYVGPITRGLLNKSCGSGGLQKV